MTPLRIELRFVGVRRRDFVGRQRCIAHTIDHRVEARVEMRLFAALGPGNIVAAQRKQLADPGVKSATSIIYSGQLYEYCRARGITALVASHNGAVDELEAPPVRFVNV